MKIIYKLFTKRTFLFILVCHISLLSFATTYYVSTSGNDSNSGLTSALAWKTLTKVNGRTFYAGDNVLFNRGETFYGSLIVSQSGTSGNPITYGAYGTGANPIITGFTSVTAWTNLGNNIWESTNTVSNLSTCNMVSINGENTPMGRYPNLGTSNDGYLRIQSWTDMSITNSTLTGTPNWTGAECVTRTHNTRLDRTLIVSQSGSTLNLAKSNGGYITNFGFFIQNSALTLDVQNEWYFNPNTKKIKVYSVGQPTDVKVASVDYIINSPNDFVTVENLSIIGANLNGFVMWRSSGETKHVKLLNCAFSFIGTNAVWTVHADYLNIEDCSINYCNGTAVRLDYTSHIVVKNNDVQNNGIIKGADIDGGAYAAISNLGTIYALIENNRIINTGNNGINFDGDSIIIKNNYIDTFNQTIDDGAGITGGGRANKNVDTGNSITGNIVINGLGAAAGTNAPDGATGGQSEGIYTADDITYLTISNNSIANCANNGIYATYCDHIYVTGNTVYNCSSQQLLFKVQSQLSNDRIVSDNKFIAKTANQLTAQYNYQTSIAGSYSLVNNNIYARPIANTDIIREWNQSGPATNKTLSEWQIFSGQDANSKLSTQTISFVNDLQFEYNATTSTKTITLSRPMMDVKGTKYATSVTLQPFTSVVLMKDLTPAVVPGSPTSVIAFAGNTNATVTFTAPLINGGSTITGYTVTSIPSGGIDANAGSTSLSHLITGLTNNTTYSFTVKAINSVGSSIASNSSNSVTPTSTGSIEYKSICDGLNYNGWTATGKYTRTLTTKAGGDSIVTTYLTVNPKYSVAEDITIKEGENYNGWSTSGKYSRSLNSVSGCDSIVTTNLTVTITAGKEGSINYTQTISLKRGNNLVSSNLLAVNPDMNLVMKSLIDQGALYKMQDEAGRSLEYWGSYGGWINRIGNLSATEGYNVNVKFDCSLVISGTPVTLPLNIPLTKGWNFISFPQTVTVNAMSVIQTLIDQNKLVKVQDETGKSIEKLKNIGWVNNIGNFVPGKGYKVYVNSNTSLNIQQSYPKSADILAEANTTEYFKAQFEGNGICHMNINMIGLSESGLTVGDELAAYDGEICVGALKVAAEHLLSGTASLISSYSTDEQIKNGFTNGDQIQIYTWNKVTGVKTELHVELLDGTLTFAQNGSVLIKMNNLATAINFLSEEVKINVYPNPCKGNFTVSLNVLPNLGSRIEILDMTGRMILSRKITNQSEVFNLENQVSGLYLVKTIIGSNPNIHKLIVNK